MAELLGACADLVAPEHHAHRRQPAAGTSAIADAITTRAPSAALARPNFVRKTSELRPPDPALIDDALGDIIAKAKRASAITALVGHLFNFVSKVIS